MPPAALPSVVVATMIGRVPGPGALDVCGAELPDSVHGQVGLLLRHEPGADCGRVCRARAGGLGHGCRGSRSPPGRWRRSRRCWSAGSRRSPAATAGDDRLGSCQSVRAVHDGRAAGRRARADLAVDRAPGWGGAAVAFYSPASTGLTPETVPARLLPQANGLMSIARYAAFPPGPRWRDAGGNDRRRVRPVARRATYGTSALLLSRLHLPAQVSSGERRRTSSASCARAGRRSPSTPGSGC